MAEPLLGVIFWTSYFFPDGDTHLNSIYDGATGRTRQYWSLAWLPGERYLGRPVYLLTSDVTFSGGEDFPITPTFEITVPIARSVNPITGANWEGTGVEPDMAVPAAEAFDVAYREAVRHVLSTSTSQAVLTEARAALG